MSLRLFYLLIWCFSLSSLSGQTKLEQAKKDLRKLKEGMLLVRLQTKNRSIAILEETGRTREAEAMRLEQNRINKDIILSFSQVFTFCPVYFFYADDSDKIRQGEIAGTVFGTDLNHPDTTELKDRFLTGEFAETKNLGIDGFIIMDEDLIPLESPFPFFQRKYMFLGIISLTRSRMIESMNDQLWETYKLWFPEKN